ncbi:MAG: NAD-dependent epimerase/dehydratase family protein [Candidatus Bathyarchaeia archaeon]
MSRPIALVGCGAVSRAFYVPACRNIPQCRIEWFVDKDRERAKGLAKDYGSGKATSDFKETIGSVEAAIIALPNHLHAEATLAFLQAGRDVLCEKPIATNSSEGMKMVEASNESGTRLAINLIRRRYNSFRTAKQLLDAGMLGRVKEVKCQEGRIFAWPVSSMDLLNPQRAGGGVLMDWGTHNLDSLRWLLSGELELVSYEDDSLGGVEANCNLQFKIKNVDGEIPCEMMLGRSRILPSAILISGDRGSLVISQDDLNCVYLRIGDSVHRIEPSEEKSKALQDKDYFAEQVAKFLDKSSRDYVQGIDAVKVLNFIENCYRNRRQMIYPWEYTQSKPINPSRPFSELGTILVVGASGFLGTRLVEKLSVDMGLRVRAAVHRPGAAARLARLPVEFVECDVLDPQQVDKAVDGCDVVVNCTSGSGGRSVYDVSVKGTSNLLEAAAKCHVKKYVHMSSAAIHGFSHRGSIVDEKSRFVFLAGPYERGKIKSEKIVAEYARSIPVVILRPTLIYGPYSSSWTTEIIQRIRDHRTTIVGGTGLANLIYVDDVVDAIICAIEKKDANGETFIINNDRKRVLWKEYIRAYAEPLGTSPVSSPEYNADLHRVKAVFSMLRDSVTIMGGVMKSPQVLALLAQVPVIVKVGSMIIKGQRRKNIEASVTSEMTVPLPDPKILLKYEGTTKQFYKLLTCQAVFSASKSRKLLGFEPSTSIEEGTAKSVEWAKWAGYYDFPPS